jgi:hypothetical protein
MSNSPLMRGIQPKDVPFNVICKLTPDIFSVSLRNLREENSLPLLAFTLKDRALAERLYNFEPALNFVAKPLALTHYEGNYALYPPVLLLNKFFSFELVTTLIAAFAELQEFLPDVPFRQWGCKVGAMQAGTNGCYAVLVPTFPLLRATLSASPAVNFEAFQQMLVSELNLTATAKDLVLASFSLPELLANLKPYGANFSEFSRHWHKWNSFFATKIGQAENFL